MAKIIKRRKVRLSGLATLVMLLILPLWLFTTLITNTRDANITMRIQEMSEELEQLQKDNQTLNYEIQNLENKDRVYEIAQTADMGQISDNIISIIGE